MINLYILNKKYKMPSELSEISLLQGMQIMSALEDDLNIVTKKSIISLLSGLSINIIKHFEDDSIEEIWNKLQFLKDDVTITHWISFKLKGKLYGLKPMNSLTVKEWAQIEYYLTEGESSYDYIGELIATLFRPIIRKNNTFRNILINVTTKLFVKGVSPRIYKSYEIEDLNDHHDKNADLFLDNMDFNFGFSVIHMVKEFNKIIRDKYPIIFKTDEQIEAIADLDDKNTTPEFEDIWGYYNIVCSISDSIQERDIWWEKPLTHFYKYISYVKQKHIYTER